MTATAFIFPALPASDELADRYAEWQAPYWGPADERGEETRRLAALLLAAPIRTAVGDMMIKRRSWAREAAARAEASGHLPGSPAFWEALGLPEYIILTSDGGPAQLHAWCGCDPDEDIPWIRYERWTGQGRASHGWLCQRCRAIGQTG